MKNTAMTNFLCLKIPWLLSIFIILSSGCIIWGIMSSRLILSPPRDKNQILPKQLVAYYEELRFKSTDGLELEGWFIPYLFNPHQNTKLGINSLSKGPEFVNEPNAKGTIILCHGFATNKSDLIGFIPFLNEHGYNVFMFDFRAHGNSPGSCSLGYYEVNDLLGAVNYLKNRQDVNSEKIGAIGVSMGGAIVFMAAAKTPYLKAVVGDSSFLSFERTVTRFAKLFYNLPKFPFVYLTIKAVEFRLGFKSNEADTAKYIDKISPRAIFIIHGENDKRILLEDAQLLYKLAKEPKQMWIVPLADHLESRGLMQMEYEKKIIEFFDKYLRSE